VFTGDGAQEAGFDAAGQAGAFVDADKGVGSVEEALAGARDIIAEWISEDAAGRAAVRTSSWQRPISHRG
jgi:uncharacterized protein